LGSSDRREREKQELRARIMDAARKLFAEKGYEAVTVRTIAEAIEYSPRTLYLHFKDKEDLIRALCREDFSAFGAGLGSLAAVKNPVERLKRIGLAYAEFAKACPNHYKLMFMSTPPAQEDHPKEVTPEEDAYALLLATVQEAIAAGRFRPEARDPHEAAQVIWSGMHGVMALCITHCQDMAIPWVPIDRRVETMIDVLIRGFIR
jgi:AcrR family transcriptional regulator